MRQPSLQTRALGHPAVVLPMAGVTLLVVYVCSQDVSAVPFALICLVLMGRIMAANRTMTDYKVWRREWDAMEDRPAASRVQWRAKLAIAVAIPAYFIASEAGYLAFDHRSLAGLAPWAIALLVLAATAFAIVRALSRGTVRLRGRTKAFAVRSCNSRSLPVPDLVAAYRALPTHCHIAMGSPQ